MPVVTRFRADANNSNDFLGKACKSWNDMALGSKLFGRLRRLEWRRMMEIMRVSRLGK